MKRIFMIGHGFYCKSIPIIGSQYYSFIPSSNISIHFYSLPGIMIDGDLTSVLIDQRNTDERSIKEEILKRKSSRRPNNTRSKLSPDRMNIFLKDIPHSQVRSPTHSETILVPKVQGTIPPPPPAPPPLPPRHDSFTKTSEHAEQFNAFGANTLLEWYKPSTYPIQTGIPEHLLISDASSPLDLVHSQIYQQSHKQIIYSGEYGTILQLDAENFVYSTPYHTGAFFSKIIELCTIVLLDNDFEFH